MSKCENTEAITAEELIINNFFEFIDNLPSKPEGEAKEMLDKVRERFGVQSPVIDAMFTGYLAGFEKGGEIMEYLYKLPDNQ